jgi:hypothetical protein
MTIRKDGDEPFLSRWSRLKGQAREHESAKPEKAAAERASLDPGTPEPVLPPLERLTFDSDFRVFFHPKVSEQLRRAALKKLFSDPRFNVMDGLDVYIEDYTKSEPIPAALLARLRQARDILEQAKGDRREEQARSLGDASAEEGGGPMAGQDSPRLAPAGGGGEPSGERLSDEASGEPGSAEA